MTHRKTWVAIAVCSLFLAACGKSPESTTEHFYMAVSKGEITEAQSYVSAHLIGMLGQSKISAALSAEAERMRACGGIKNIDVKLQGEGELRSGVATVTFAGKCPPKTENAKLIKEDGKWKITASK